MSCIDRCWGPIRFLLTLSVRQKLFWDVKHDYSKSIQPASMKCNAVCSPTYENKLLCNSKWIMSNKTMKSMCYLCIQFTHEKHLRTHHFASSKKKIQIPLSGLVACKKASYGPVYLYVLCAWSLISGSSW